MGDNNNKLNAENSFSELYNLKKPITDENKYVNQKIIYESFILNIKFSTFNFTDCLV